MQWPMHHRTEFWDGAASFIKSQDENLQQRSGNFTTMNFASHYVSGTCL